jgi:hypothetical protein
MAVRHRIGRPIATLLMALLVPAAASRAADAPRCAHTVWADVVALDQPIMINRLGTVRPGGMIYALRRDVVSTDNGATLSPGKVQLRPERRPRPLTLRANKGDCLSITFQNLLSPAQFDVLQPNTRAASIHVAGMELRNGMSDDGSDAGNNSMRSGTTKGIVAPGETTEYLLYAAEEGTNLLYSTTADFNGFNTDQLTLGLFGAVNVEPVGSEWYRGQVSQADLRTATTGHTPDGHPILNYDATFTSGPRQNLPILRMLAKTNHPQADFEIVSGDLTAVVTGPNHGRFSKLERPDSPNEDILPDRQQPFREVTVIYNEAQDAVQPFPQVYNVSTPGGTDGLDNVDFSAGTDGFAINYGSAGIVNEILANRLKLGPAADCPECKFEEFFLSSWSNGDPAMVVDNPANLPCRSTPLAQNEPLAHTQQLLPAIAGTAIPWPPCFPDGKIRATKAFYPDDPSNVYHAYLGDHAVFRILHAGASVHHVHHHHAHQWLWAPMMKGSNYLDSQSIGPGASFTLELSYAGSGNQNLTAGDSIFHCHFYPHFASGMWALFRVHDVFEEGTELDAEGRPVAHARALPDPEIKDGTPIPGVVPLPTLAMAPMPAAVEIADGQVHFPQPPKSNPGYPFFVPGLAGHRPPHPPMAFDHDTKDASNVLDGGLPRHLVVGGHVFHMVTSAADFTKDLDSIDAIQLPEPGTEIEKLAMKAHATRLINSFEPDGTAAQFTMNGMPAIPGGPFADPAPYVPTQELPPQRRYQGADIQVNAVFNKAGWHYPQQRMRALWKDVNDIEGGIKPPEPLFIRAQVGELVTYSQSNLVPSYYELDDFQVRTPTDIIGQHIHLVKFDVLAADGAANGFNYEDGTFSPQEVRDRINAINATGGLCQPAASANVPSACPAGAPRQHLTAKPIPELGNGPHNSRVGAQATLHAWYIDPLGGRPSSYMTVFTHDHFSPSTHQEAGLYAGLLVEPKGSTWTSVDGATTFGARSDGGPTSFAANILLPGEQKADSYREFALEWQDTQLAYGPASKAQPDCYEGQDPVSNGCQHVTPGTYAGWQTTDPSPSFMINALNPPRQPNAITIPPPQMTNPPTRPQTPFGLAPFIITDFGFGISSLNYRAEPLTLRDLPGNVDAPPAASDPAFAFGSIKRHNAAPNIQPSGQQIDPDCRGGAVTKGGPCPVFPVNPIGYGMEPFDPYTPLLRAYPKDKIQIRTLVGGFTTMHAFSTHGLPWKFEPYVENSGYRASQFAVLSEHFEMLFDAPRGGDYLYNPGSSYEGLVNGLWGLLRVYDKPADKLAPLPGNFPAATVAPVTVPAGQDTTCTSGKPCLRHFDVSAISIRQLIGGHGLVYNARGLPVIDPKTGGIVYQQSETLSDPDAIVYIREEDLCQTCQSGQMLKNPNARLEPLLLRVASGDWIEVTLHNRLDPKEPVFTKGEPASRMGLYTTSYYFNPFVRQGTPAALDPALFTPSTEVGLHAQMLALDIRSDDGANVGDNPSSTVPVGKQRTYRWYAGTLSAGTDGKPQSTPVEFGAVNLLPADELMQAYHGLFGGLIVEPAGSTWVEDPGSHVSATVFRADGTSFRDFTLFMQNDVALQLNGTPFTPVVNGNPTYSALSAVNYRTDPFFYRYGQRISGVWSGGGLPQSGGDLEDWTKLTAADLKQINDLNWPGTDTSRAMSNSLVGGDPATPILGVPAGMPARIRLLGPPGNGDNQQTFELYGHVWQFQPYQDSSKVIGDNPASPTTGTQGGVGPTAHYDIVLPSAGGSFKVPGDYVWRSADALQFQVGVWGLMRVAPVPQPQEDVFPDTIAVQSVEQDSGAAGNHPNCTVKWTSTVHPAADTTQRQYAGRFTVNADGAVTTVNRSTADADGQWSAHVPCPLSKHLTLTSEFGGVAEWWAAPAVGTPHPTPVAAAPPVSLPPFQTLRRGHPE